MENNFLHISKDFSPASNLRYGVDTSASTIVCTLPPVSRPGFSVFFADWSGTFGKNNFTIKTTSGCTINDTATALVVDTSGDSIGLFWTGTTWRTYE